MTVDSVEFSLEPEKTLIKTLIMGKPLASAFLMASLNVFIICLGTIFYWMGPDAWTQLLPSVNAEVFQHGQWWRIFTAIFVHADLEHLLSNMLMLWIFIFFVYGYFGARIFYFAFFLAGLANAFAIATYKPDVELIGASGLVYLLGGLWLVLYFFIQRQYSVLHRFLRVFGIALVLFSPSSFIPSTSYRTHAIGFFMGIVLGVFYFYKNKEKIRSHEKYKITYPEPLILEH